MERREFLKNAGLATIAATTVSIPSIVQAALPKHIEYGIYPVSYADLIEHAKVRHDKAWKDIHYKSGELTIPLSLMDANVPQLHDFLPIIMREYVKLAAAQGKKVRLILDRRHMRNHPIHGWVETAISMQVRSQSDEIFVRMTPYPMKGEKDKDMVRGYFIKSRLGRKQNVSTLVPLSEVA